MVGIIPFYGLTIFESFLRNQRFPCLEMLNYCLYLLLSTKKGGNYDQNFEGNKFYNDNETVLTFSQTIGQKERYCSKLYGNLKPLLKN